MFLLLKAPHPPGSPQDAVVAALTTKPAPGPTLPVAKGIPVTEATSIAPGTPTAVAIVASPTPSTGAEHLDLDDFGWHLSFATCLVNISKFHQIPT